MEISPKKLIIALALVFLLGVAFSVVNGIYYSEESSTLPLIVYGISFVSIILGGALVVLFQWKLNDLQLRKVLKILPGEERRVVRILLDNKGSIEQNKLVALSGYNKVKISRILKVLEQREVIKKTNLGNTNLIVLTI
ncbi:hypothetical protein K9L97_01395 [Candidatus Woesearchaeota archaeon]|nr:hypothetical protein [Candidatus Woesearchaeota archaeon]